MPQATAWLKCRASQGQFRDELAVSGIDYLGEEFSFFVAQGFVDCYGGDPQCGEVDALLQVRTLESNGSLVLVMLPGLTFSNGSTITVSTDDLQMTQGAYA